MLRALVVLLQALKLWVRRGAQRCAAAKDSNDSIYLTAAARRSLGVELSERPWPCQVVALYEVHTEPLKLAEHGRRLDGFRNRRDTKRLTYLADRFHHAPVDRIVGDLFDELAVYLQEVDRQCLQVKER